MSERIERFIAMAFDDWKKDQTGHVRHPGEEDIACFLEGKLSEQDARRVREHISTCDACSKLVAADLSLSPAEEIAVPGELLERCRSMVTGMQGMSALEIAVKLTRLGFEIINTTGDVLLGQELIPAAVLRSRDMKEFKDEVVILKDFADLIVEVRLQAGPNAGFTLTVSGKDKKTQRPRKDLRITLLKDDVELESRISDAGKAVFEHVEPGAYCVDVVGPKEKIAAVVIDVR